MSRGSGHRLNGALELSDQSEGTKAAPGGASTTVKAKDRTMSKQTGCPFCKNGTPATRVVELRISDRPETSGKTRGKSRGQVTRRMCWRHAMHLFNVLENGGDIPDRRREQDRRHEIMRAAG
jgi:hypothetical protein